MGFKRWPWFRNQYATTIHVATLIVIVEDCRDKKEDLIYFPIDFRHAFDIVHGYKLCKTLEEIGIPHEIPCVVIRFYENFISKMKYILSGKWTLM